MHEWKKNCKRKFIYPTNLQWKHTKCQVWASVKTMRHRPEKEIFHVSYKVNTMMIWWCTSRQYTRISRPSHNSQVHTKCWCEKEESSKKNTWTMHDIKIVSFSGVYSSFHSLLLAVAISLYLSIYLSLVLVAPLFSSSPWLLFYFHFILSSQHIWSQQRHSDALDITKSQDCHYEIESIMCYDIRWEKNHKTAVELSVGFNGESKRKPNSHNRYIEQTPHTCRPTTVSMIRNVWQLGSNAHKIYELWLGSSVFRCFFWTRKKILQLVIKPLYIKMLCYASANKWPQRGMVNADEIKFIMCLVWLWATFFHPLVLAIN